MSTAVIIFSGGQDSTTCLVQALNQYQQVHCLTFDYQQRHRQEIAVARQLAHKLGVTHHQVLDVSLLNALSVSSLTRAEIPVPSATEHSEGLPSTFVPGRNILFFTLAAIYACQVEAETVISGVCETDFSGYPDCRQAFVTRMEQALKLGLDYPLQLETPLMSLTKAETWALADYWQQFDLIRNETLTCYNGISGAGCGDCAACHLRARGLQLYLNNPETVMQQMKQKTGLP